ncbi:MAG TPA: LLM class flavin-dependent oxidoreductase [Xanthobacteraceae bacterium]|nr:LLM class flavin-dependent oxidoreductase [Xanthobacteraceae bacterium]
MKFGVFDHLDDNKIPLGQFYENRLKLAEAYDRAGFHAYHIAEHHSTPLGMGASPGIFMSAVAQRTKNIKFGPLVYLLPFYHPIRLIEEVAMLDQMSNGRFQLGVGRGVSPFETKFYGLDFAQTQGIYHEAFQLLMKGLTSEELTFEGKYFNFQKVPMLLRPIQKPHPPLWYGTTIPENTPWPAANDVNIVIIGLRNTIEACVARYTEERSRLGKDPKTMPLMGASKHVVVADTDAEAMKIARRGYATWRDSFNWLFRRFNAEPRIADLLPPTFDELMKIGNGVAGSPETVRDWIKAEVEATGINYFVSWLAFGDIAYEESLRSVELYSQKVIPALTRQHAPA